MAITSGSEAEVGAVFPYVKHKMKEAANLGQYQWTTQPWQEGLLPFRVTYVILWDTHNVQYHIATVAHLEGLIIT